MPLFKSVMAGAGLLLATTLISGCSASEAQTKATRPARPPEAGYVVMKTEAASLQTELPGRTTPYAVSEVRPQVTGLIKARLFKEGTVVHAGQVLYRIDPATYAAAVAQSKAQLANAQASLTTARLKSERYGELVKIKAVSQQDYDDADATFRQADASVQQAQASLQSAQINLGFTEVRAPITGRIGRSMFTEGALVTANQADALTTIQRLDPIYVDLQQSSAQLLALRRSFSTGASTPTDRKVKLTLEDASVYPLQGVLQFAEATVDAATGAVALRATFPNPDGLLLPGMYVRAKLVEQTVQNAILAPQSGVSRDAKGQATVMVLAQDNKAVTRSITADRTYGDKWVVTAGLSPGDKVIVEGLGRIREGQAVTPVPAGSPPSQPSGGPDAGGRGHRQARG